MQSFCAYFLYKEKIKKLEEIEIEGVEKPKKESNIDCGLKEFLDNKKYF